MKPIILITAIAALLSPVISTSHAADKKSDKKDNLSDAERNQKKIAEWKAKQALEEWKSKQAVEEWKAKQAVEKWKAEQAAKAATNDVQPRTAPAPRPRPDQPVAVAPAAQVAGLSESESQVIALANNARRKAGLGKVSTDTALSACSRDHSKDMTTHGFFSHQSPINGKAHFSQRAARFRVSANSENIAQSTEGAASVFNDWMNSPGHRANILSPSATRIGVGQNGDNWTMMLGD